MDGRGRSGPRTSMNRAMICTWLGLPDERWPPDPYALLGITPGECEAARIEQRVQERMAKLRGYQLSHPAEATEGMNRVAQAFIYLIEHHCPRPAPPAIKNGAVPAVAPNANAAIPASTTPARQSLGDTAVAHKTRTDWEAAPPPVRSAKKTPLPAVPVAVPEPPPVRDAVSAAERLTPAQIEEQAARDLAEDSEEAYAGLVSLPAVVRRVDLTRHLLIVWRKIGRYLGNPRRKLTRGVDRRDFAAQMEALLEAAEGYPGFLGQPGRPGYRAVALAHLAITPDVFNAMGEESREQLARDWMLAHRVLLAHRVFLLRRFKALRRRSVLGRLSHAIAKNFEERPVLWTGVVAALAIAICALAGGKLFRLIGG